MRILVADDHSLFRDGIVNLLEAGGHEIVGQASNGAEAVRLALELEPELALLDIHMPVMDGLEALGRIKAACPTIQVVMLTVSEEDNDLRRAIRSGADGYILKHINSTEFLALLERLKSGNAALSSSIATRLFKLVGHADKKGSKKMGLSMRELEILRCVAGGKSNHEIAAELSVSENTVKFHIKNIIQKLSVSNRTEAVTYAIQEGIL